MEDTNRWTHRNRSSEGSAGPQRLVCPSECCSADGWQIEADPHHPYTWQISSEDGRGRWTVAAEAPVCPLCGEDLARHYAPALEHNPFSRFVRSLAA